MDRDDDMWREMRDREVRDGTAEERERRRGPRPWHADPKLLALRAKWYAKLKKSGFNDIEMIRRDDGESFERLRGVSRHDVERTWTPATQRYFELAVQWLREIEARGAPEQRKGEAKGNLAIWALHAEMGYGLENISRKLRMGRHGCWKRMRYLKDRFAEWREAEHAARAAEEAGDEPAGVESVDAGMPS